MTANRLQLFSLILISLTLPAFPKLLRAESVDIRSVYKVVDELRAQMAVDRQKVEEQRRIIDLQGREIADLKNLIGRDSTVTPYIPPQDKEKFREQVAQVFEEFRLSEKKETPEEKRLTTIYDDGFYLKGKDDTLRIGGWYQADALFYDRRNEGNNRFRNRAARLDIRGALENDFEYRLYAQFAGSAANLQEAWLMYKHFPWARIKFGQVLVPFSLESQYSARWLDFAERSIGVSNLQPAEDLGLMVFGNPFGGIVEYGGGVFNGRIRTLDDNNDNFDFGGRVVLAPFIKSGRDLWKDFYAGGSFLAGHSDETLASTGFTTSSGNRFLTYSSNTRHAGNRIRFGGELQWIYGPGDIKAEYVGGRFDNVERTGQIADVDVNSWYASATYILTGERKQRNKPLIPKRNFSIQDGGWGAWEAAVRFEQFFLNDSPFHLGLATGVDRVNAYTLGLNGWLNKHIRMIFDYTLNDFSNPLLIGSRSLGEEHLWIARAQYDF